MKKKNLLLIIAAIVAVVTSSYFVFGIADAISILVIIALLVAVISVPMTSVRDKQHRVVNVTRRRR